MSERGPLPAGAGVSDDGGIVRTDHRRFARLWRPGGDRGGGRRLGGGRISSRRRQRPHHGRFLAGRAKGAGGCRGGAGAAKLAGLPISVGTPRPLQLRPRCSVHRLAGGAAQRNEDRRILRILGNRRRHRPFIHDVPPGPARAGGCKCGSAVLKRAVVLVPHQSADADPPAPSRRGNRISKASPISNRRRPNRRYLRAIASPPA